MSSSSSSISGRGALKPSAWRLETRRLSSQPQRALKLLRRAIISSALFVLSLTITPQLTNTSVTNIIVTNISVAAPPAQRSAEMEFDARVIQGQRAEGAVYLFQRAQRPLPPLLSFRRDYLGAILRPVLGDETPAARAHLSTPAMSRGEAFTVTPYLNDTPSVSPQLKEGAQEATPPKAHSAPPQRGRSLKAQPPKQQPKARGRQRSRLKTSKAKRGGER